LNRLEELFDVDYPATLIFKEQKQDPKGFNFVSSSGQNNGIVAKVRAVAEAKLYPAGSVTVPLKGSVMRAHVQSEPFYCAHQIAVLIPKVQMLDQQKLYYVLCLREVQLWTAGGPNITGSPSAIA
jgi:hypothetical protein